MGKATGFLEFKRKEHKKRSVEQRIKDWNELWLPQDFKELKEQGGRCMNCGIPFCHSGILLNGMTAGCPLKNLIPEWNELVWLDQWEDAYKRLIRTNPFPEFTGRVCPAPCEGSCTEGHIMESMAINSIEHAIIEKAFKEGWVKHEKTSKSTKKNIAIIGSGPSGISAAYYLNKAGHNITIYEKNDRAGGLLMYGIPNMKLDKKIIDRRLKILAELGVQFIFNTEIGVDYDSKELAEKYDAVLLCCGAGKPRELKIEGIQLKGVYNALDFLKANTKKVIGAEIKENEYINVKDKNVIVIGGGDTGTDCVATSIRQGCKSITQLEIMPKQPEKRKEESNPWPEWPIKTKTDYGQEEAILIYNKDPRNYSVSTKKIIGDERGNVKGLETVEIIWEKNPLGQNVPIEKLESKKTWKADIVLIAMGFAGAEDKIPDQLCLKRDSRTNVKAEYEIFQTNNEKIFVAGDMRRGQSLVVWAIQEGKLAAKAVDKYLTGVSLIK